MITYTLAKELKDAGFEIPFNSKGELICKSQALAREQHDFVSCDHQQCVLNLEEVYFPTLSELIEACMGFYYPCSFNMGGMNTWWAVMRNENNTKALVPIQCGSSPEIAVARLWLVLNKK